jgi:uncharacterized protein (TIGR02594 family)
MTEPIWLSVARAFKGLVEVPGTGSNPVILYWADDLGIRDIYTNDDMAWCALKASRIALACQLPLPGTRYELMRAKSFETWGRPLALPTLGAWLVFKRDGGYHVGWYIGERADAYRVWGGNQQNTVGAIWKKKTELTACRWPEGYPLPLTGALWLKDDGSPTSVNEA